VVFQPVFCSNARKSKNTFGCVMLLVTTQMFIFALRAWLCVFQMSICHSVRLWIKVPSREKKEKVLSWLSQIRRTLPTDRRESHRFHLSLFSWLLFNSGLGGICFGPVMFMSLSLRVPVCLRSFGDSRVSTLQALIAQCFGRWGNGLYSVSFMSSFKSVWKVVEEDVWQAFWVYIVWM